MAKRQGGDSRGSSYSRRKRKLKLLAVYGDGDTCRCTHCPKILTFETVEADRIIPGSKGGTYKFSNVQPACRSCNASRADRLDWVPPRLRGTQYPVTT